MTSSQELLLLGLLKKGPKHGYEIKKIIKEDLYSFTTLETESIYYSLMALAHRGLLTRKKGRSGKRPEKYVYSLTPEGHDRFEVLINKSFSTLERPYFNIDLALYFLPFIQKDAFSRRLRARLILLKRLERVLDKFKTTIDPQKSFHLLAIVEHNLEFLRTEIRFFSQLLEKFH